MEKLKYLESEFIKTPHLNLSISKNRLWRNFEQQSNIWKTWRMIFYVHRGFDKTGIFGTLKVGDS
jgi:hypothetical protein